MMTPVSTRIIDFYKNLEGTWVLPDGIELLFPYNSKEVMACVEKFYIKYFSDHHSRLLIVGINPGRFGAGITGIPFTDPKILSEICKIENPWPKRNELSSQFIYEWIGHFGSVEDFYSKFFISSVCPLGFVKDNKNINYYDDRSLFNAVKPYIILYLRLHLDFGIESRVVYCLGKGLNYKYLKQINDEESLFHKVVPLPHPRWIMQYRRKKKDDYIDLMTQKLHDQI